MLQWQTILNSPRVVLSIVTIANAWYQPKQINHINAFERPLKNEMDKSKSSSTETNIYCAAHMKLTIQSADEINASLQSKLM